MGVRNRREEPLARLDAKTLDARFKREIREGLSCSPFEAEAVLEVVKEVYGPVLDASDAEAVPGRLTLLVVSAEEPAGKPIARCRTSPVHLTVHRGSEDDRLLHGQGPAAFRRARIPALCQEALSQGGLLTREDLAYRVFFVTPRTITRDLQALRAADPGGALPLRSTRHDIGPVMTHRVEIVRAALSGKTTSEICRDLRHSPEAVANYLSTFTRCVQLKRRGLNAGEIAFLLRRGASLIQRYLELLASCETDPTFAYHLEELLRMGQCGGGKKHAAGGSTRG